MINFVGFVQSFSVIYIIYLKSGLVSSLGFLTEVYLRIYNKISHCKH